MLLLLGQVQTFNFVINGNKQKKNKNEIIIPSFSWLSVAEAVLLLGYKPIYVDVETMTFNISVKDVQKK